MDTSEKNVYEWAINMKKCSTSVIREMQINTTIRYYHIPLAWLKLMTDSTTYLHECRQLKFLFNYFGKLKQFFFFCKIKEVLSL